MTLSPPRQLDHRLALYRESGIPPIDLLLKAQQLRFATRLQSLDHFHPLVQRSTNPATLQPPNRLPWDLRNPPQGYRQRKPPYLSRLQRTAATITSIIHINPPRPQLLLKDFQASLP